MSTVTDCFVQDPLGGGLAVYDAGETCYYATRYGFERWSGHKHIAVPLFPFTDVEVHDRCMILLLEAVKNTGWRKGRAYDEAEQTFERHGTGLYRVLTSADHHLIPPGRRIAIADPEVIGRIVLADHARDHERGVVLFNPEFVIGYKDPGRTSYEHLLGDYLQSMEYA